VELCAVNDFIPIFIHQNNGNVLLCGTVYEANMQDVLRLLTCNRSNKATYLDVLGGNQRDKYVNSWIILSELLQI